MADPNNTGINAASGPFGMNPAETKIGAFGQGILRVPEWLMETSRDIDEAIYAAPGQIMDYLKSPSEYGEEKIKDKAVSAQFGDIEARVDQPNMFFGGPEGEFGGLDVDMSGLDVEYQMEQEAEKKRGEEAEAFRAKEKQLVDSQGGLNSMSIADSTAITQDQTNEGFMAAMDDFFEGARGAGPEVPKKRTIEDYKQAFSDATGIDTSGEVDKRDALMAFGLALMQNKAGKNFNVSKMLQEVGVAGDKAMPALQKAKDRARQGALAGGKYALQTQSADKATRAAAKEKMMNRDKYWVFEKGKGGSAFGGFDKGQFEDLNKYELDKLMNDPEFQEKYDFVSGADRLSVLEKRADGQDKGDMWESTSNQISMIGGDVKGLPPELIAVGSWADSNYGGTAPNKFLLKETNKTVVDRFIDLQQSVTSGGAKFEELIGYIDQGITVPDQLIRGAVQIARNFGVELSENPSSVADAQRILSEIAVRNATEILQESGKTLSDNDRKRVEELVGEISFGSGDAKLVKKKLKEIYNLTVVKPQKNLDRAMSWLTDNAGVSFGKAKSLGDPPTDQAELDALNQIAGTKYTMKDFK